MIHHICKDNIEIELQDNYGYTIRHKDYIGATFTIDFKGNLIVGQSGRINYSLKAWNEIQDAITEGKNYMSRYIFVGATVFNIDKTKFIRKKDYKLNTIYKDSRGRIIIILGKNERGYYIGHINNSNNLRKVEVIGDTIIIDLNTNKGVDFKWFKTQPNELVEEIVSYSSNVINNIKIDIQGLNYTWHPI